MSGSWPKIDPETLADRVYHKVRGHILEARLRPGEFIREQEISKAMGVSRTPVREALGRLASEGFLERIPRRGFCLPDESPRDLLELYPIVASLEALAGRLAFPRLDEKDILRLKELNRGLEEAKESNDAEMLNELNSEFHRFLWVKSENSKLCSLLDELRARIRRLELWYYSDRYHAEKSISEHAEIIRAIEDGNHERALKILEGNMSLTLRSLIEETESKKGESL